MQRNIILSIISLFIVITFTSCNKIREYQGTPITIITYQTVDYNGGYTTNHVIDLVNGKYLSNDFLPGGDNQEPLLEEKKVFTKEESKTFIDGCYTKGLFNLESNYKRNGIIDGSGWTLTIEYEDGKKRISTGDNAAPYKVFNNCSTFFYDLCKTEVLGSLPEYYVSPPDISLSFHYDIGDYGSASDNSLAWPCRSNYKWNKNIKEDTNLYEVNNSNSNKNKFIMGNNYELVLYTTNYNYKERFTKLTLKSYDFTESLDNEKTIYANGWFKQIEFTLELNKIYTYTLEYKNGDYVTYTFNTLAQDSPLLFGKYRYSIYNKGYSQLVIKEDHTFELYDFYYFDVNNDLKIAYTGDYEISDINGKTYLILIINNDKIMLEVYIENLFINFKLTTFNLESLHLDIASSNCGQVEFNYE